LKYFFIIITTITWWISGTIWHNLLKAPIKPNQPASMAWWICESVDSELAIELM